MDGHRLRAIAVTELGVQTASLTLIVVATLTPDACVGPCAPRSRTSDALAAVLAPAFASAAGAATKEIGASRRRDDEGDRS
jgi:hypothetical protein